MDEHSKIEKYIVASDVGSGRDGIGIEVYSGNDMLLEVFRDDTKKTREVTLYIMELDLELVEQAIALFKKVQVSPNNTQHLRPSAAGSLTRCAARRPCALR